MTNYIRRQCFALIFALALLPSVYAASPVAPTDRISLTFDKVPLMQFIEATYRVMLGRQYVVDPRLVDDSRRVTISVQDVPKMELEAFVKMILSDAGVGVQDRNGVVFFVPASVVEKQSSPNPVSVDSSNVSVPPALAPAPTGAVSSSPPGAAHMELYRPRYRSVEQLQQIANKLLTTDFKDSESVILVGAEARVVAVIKLLEQYDARPGEVLVRAAVYEFTQSGNEGFNFQGALSVLAGKLNVSLGSAVALQNAVSFRNTSLQAVLSAVSGDSRFNLVSSPTVRVRHAARARLTVGSETPVLDSLQLDKNGTPIQSVIYRPAGVILELAPSIMSDRIELDVRQEVSSFSKTNTSAINSPTLMKRSLQTVVGIEPGELIILGGLDEDKSSTTASGLPFLPSFMRSTSSEQSKTQLLLVMEVKRI